jgi:hypothetical protein
MDETRTLDELKQILEERQAEALRKDQEAMFDLEKEGQADQYARQVANKLSELEQAKQREVIEVIRSVKPEDLIMAEEYRNNAARLFRQQHGEDSEAKIVSSITMPEYNLPSGRVVKDSGERRLFPTGAQRDAGAGKGFFDCIPTMPLLRVAVGLGRPSQLELDHPKGSMIVHILRWRDGDNEQDHLAKVCFLAFHQMEPTKDEYWGGIAYGGLERLAQLYEAGAVKYQKHNWQKGMPKSVFLNSLLRHAFKVGANWDDEDHLAAVIFNAFCLMHFEDLDWKAPDGTNLNDD